MSFSLLVDSVVNSFHDIPFVPANIIVGEKTYLDRIEAGVEKVVEWLNSGKKVSTSACAPARFLEAFRKMKEPILVLTISSKHSGLFRSAQIAARMCDKRVEVFDTRSISIGAGLLADIAYELMRAGKSIEEALLRLSYLRDRVRVLLLPKNLTNLAKSGRIPSLVARLGDMVGVVPLIIMEKGELKVYRLMKSFEEGLKFMAERVSGRVLTGHIVMEPWLRELEGMLKERGIEFKRASEISGALAAHIGPGAVGAAWVSE